MNTTMESGGDDKEEDPKYNYVIGQFSIEAKDIPMSTMTFDRIAFLDDRLLFLSVFAEKSRIKQLRALMAGSVKGVSMNCRGLRCFRPTEVREHIRKGQNPTYGGRDPYRLFPGTDGYTMKRKDLDYGMSHATFASNDPGFMLVTSPVALFKQIKRSTIKNPITAPFIPEWLEYMDKELREARLLEEAYCHRCECSVFAAGTMALQRIIEKGLKAGEITIPPPPVHEKMLKQISFIVQNPVV